MSTKQNKKNIVPLGDRVLVKALVAETKTKSGIIIPDTASKERPEQGVVVAVGEGRITDDGKVIAPKVKVGDTIVFSKYQLDEIKIEGEECYVLNVPNILAIVR